jgi:hypothetical protein
LFKVHGRVVCIVFLLHLYECPKSINTAQQTVAALPFPKKQKNKNRNRNKKTKKPKTKNKTKQKQKTKKKQINQL